MEVSLPRRVDLQGTKRKACWRGYTRTRATFIKESSEAGWVRRVGLPSTYVTIIVKIRHPSIEDCGLRVGGSYGSELKCVRYGCQPNN